MTDLQSVPKQQLQNLKIVNFKELMKKFEYPDKTGFKFSEMREKDIFLPPGQPPFIN